MSAYQRHSLSAILPHTNNATTITTMIIEKLYAPLAALLCLVTMAMADHYTCNWGGPGNDPASKGWSYVCEGEKEMSLRSFVFS